MPGDRTVLNAAPPAISVSITDQVLDPAALQAAVSSNSCGAVILFIGTVRGINEGRPVLALEYSAYDAMAEKMLLMIANEAASRFGAPAIAVAHRVGTLQLGEASVIIAVAHAHRGDAFDAARYVIEELKMRVPIWKREHYADGTREWVNPAAQDSQTRAAER